MTQTPELPPQPKEGDNPLVDSIEREIWLSEKWLIEKDPQERERLLAAMEAECKFRDDWFEAVWQKLEAGGAKRPKLDEKDPFEE
jgi:hypothetical protein